MRAANVRATSASAQSRQNHVLFSYFYDKPRGNISQRIRQGAGNGLITKTRLCNVDPLKPHFYIVKLGFTWVYISFLFLLKNIDCRYSLESPRRGGSNEYLQSKFWAEIWKISEFLSENFHFLVLKFSVYLNRRVFVMGRLIRRNVEEPFLATQLIYLFSCLYLGIVHSWVSVLQVALYLPLPHSGLIQQTTNWWKFSLFFFQKTGFEISCKSSQFAWYVKPVFWEKNEKNKKNITICRLLQILPKVLSVNLVAAVSENKQDYQWENVTHFLSSELSSTPHKQTYAIRANWSESYLTAF